jgi:hypothetical protein
MKMFRFSVWRERPTETQRSWVLWFTRRHIGAEIRKRPEGFAVFRQGEEAVDQSAIGLPAGQERDATETP